MSNTPKKMGSYMVKLNCFVSKHMPDDHATAVNIRAIWLWWSPYSHGYHWFLKKYYFSFSLNMRSCDQLSFRIQTQNAFVWTGSHIQWCACQSKENCFVSIFPPGAEFKNHFTSEIKILLFFRFGNGSWAIWNLNFAFFLVHIFTIVIFFVTLYIYSETLLIISSITFSYDWTYTWI